MFLIILYIKIAFWYVTLSVNFECQLSSLNSSEDGVHNLRLLVPPSFGILQIVGYNRTEIKMR